MRVLIVEDNRDCADTQAMVIETWGYEVKVACDCESAFEIVHEYQPDVMLIDIGLPGMDGCALAKRVRTANRSYSQSAVAATQKSEIRLKKLGSKSYSSSLPTH